jgi:hypothetical protein
MRDLKIRRAELAGDLERNTLALLAKTAEMTTLQLQRAVEDLRMMVDEKTALSHELDEALDQEKERTATAVDHAAVLMVSRNIEKSLRATGRYEVWEVFDLLNGWVKKSPEPNVFKVEMRILRLGVSEYRFTFATPTEEAPSDSSTT